MISSTLLMILSLARQLRLRRTRLLVKRLLVKRLLVKRLLVKRLLVKRLPRRQLPSRRLTKRLPFRPKLSRLPRLPGRKSCRLRPREGSTWARVLGPSTSLQPLAETTIR